MAITIHAKPVVIYTIEGCRWCIKAKALLDAKHIEYQEVIVRINDLSNEIVKKFQGATTVPQIFIDDEHIGGYDKLHELDKSGELDKMLQANNSDFSNQTIDSTDESGYDSDELDLLDTTSQSDNDIL